MVANQNVVLIPFPQVVPVGPWCSRKISFSSKMMNSQHQHIQKREIVDLQKFQYKYKSEKKPWAIQFHQKMPQYKGICYSRSELITNNSKISPWSRDLFDVQFKYPFSFCLGLSATIPSLELPRIDLRWGWVFLERMQILSWIQFTTHFIEFFVVCCFD